MLGHWDHTLKQDIGTLGFFFLFYFAYLPGGEQLCFLCVTVMRHCLTIGPKSMGPLDYGLKPPKVSL